MHVTLLITIIEYTSKSFKTSFNFTMSHNAYIIQLYHYHYHTSNITKIHQTDNMHTIILLYFWYQHTYIKHSQSLNWKLKMANSGKLIYTDCWCSKLYTLKINKSVHMQNSATLKIIQSCSLNKNTQIRLFKLYNYPTNPITLNQAKSKLIKNHTDINPFQVILPKNSKYI